MRSLTLCGVETSCLGESSEIHDRVPDMRCVSAGHSQHAGHLRYVHIQSSRDLYGTGPRSPFRRHISILLELRRKLAVTDDLKLIQYIEVILVHLGYDTDTPLFKDTALRFASRMRPFAAKVEVDEGTLLAPAVEPKDESLKEVPTTILPIEFTAMCARHFMPIFGSVGLIYIPLDKHAPVRAITNMVEYHAQQFIDQHAVTRKIGRELALGMNCQAVYVVMSARHTCEGNSIVTTEWGARIGIEASQSLVERVEKSVR